jgi:hypothetical protein
VLVFFLDSTFLVNTIYPFYHWQQPLALFFYQHPIKTDDSLFLPIPLQELTKQYALPITLPSSRYFL